MEVPSSFSAARSSPALLSHLEPGRHEVVEDLSRVRASRHRAAGVLELHRLELVRVAHPDRDGDVVVPADEPGVAVVLGGAGLSPDELVAHLGGLARAAADHEPEHVLCHLADLGGEDAFPPDVVLDRCDPLPCSTLWIATGPVSSGARSARDAHAVVGDRRVRVGHLERRDALLAGRRAASPGWSRRRCGCPCPARAPPRGAASPSCRARRRPSCPRWPWPTTAMRRRDMSRRSWRRRTAPDPSRPRTGAASAETPRCCSGRSRPQAP